MLFSDALLIPQYTQFIDHKEETLNIKLYDRLVFHIFLSKMMQKKKTYLGKEYFPVFVGFDEGSSGTFLNGKKTKKNFVRFSLQQLQIIPNPLDPGVPKLRSAAP